MNSTIGGGGEVRHRFYDTQKKKSLEWDLNDWKWDGDLFIAKQKEDRGTRRIEEFQVAGILSNSSSSCSDEVNPTSGRELDKKRRVNNQSEGNLSLMLGGQVYPISENDVLDCENGNNGKKIKVLGATTSNNRVMCQVEGCDADLSCGKDYHRRHKVCETHSKASKAVVGNVLQRFCQQCSRFHVLQEFDEGKRSCRRRLAGHNKRRRKTHPEAIVNGNSVIDDRSSNYLLISLLRILSNMQSAGLTPKAEAYGRECCNNDWAMRDLLKQRSKRRDHGDRHWIAMINTLRHDEEDVDGEKFKYGG
ncbi:hypothetical protein IFM89_000004 [Coptis chinensis]|uniref:SBP-type domain-containing protein n=1 Tax=Coptis chinensis TaxID=261450 RepID=A0A835M395_9MAGN|nr:hypothetical protein IFM89_000004 [Coptis chinensis]